ncbi:MAG: discoidin domain-containing protein, partial [Planctomycetes bacterium]|nr:discoidin domain-containing protein [Planctomycetota bacterium]
METIGKIKVTATCESCLEGFEAPKACDGRQDTAWKADPYFKWLMLDAQGTFFVDHLRLNLCPEGKFYHYHVECSLDRINWHFVMEKDDDAPVREEGDLIAIKQVARFVKITVSYCAASNVV